MSPFRIVHFPLLIIYMAGMGAMPIRLVTADPLPGDGFAVAHYEALWTKSPFAVATADVANTSANSPDYALAGTAQFDGVSYASMVDKKTMQHFLLTSTQPVRGLTLVSITPGHGSNGTQAVVQMNGQTITLKPEQVLPVAPIPVAVANAPANVNPNAPSTMSPQQSRPPGMINPGMVNRNLVTGQVPPPVAMRPRLIRVPPQPPTSPR